MACSPVSFRVAPFFLLLSLSALDACGPATTSGTSDAGSDAGSLPPTYDNVSMILTRNCVFSSCHGGAGVGASMLNFQTSIANGTLLADLERPSCQYELMPLVTPGDPTQSWLYLKVAGPHGATGELTFTPDATWDHGGLAPDAMGRYPASTCPLTSRGAIVFGTIMPQGTGGLRADQAETIRQWILAGAPGP